MYQFPAFSFSRYPKFMAMVWGKSWQKLKENAKFWFFTIFRHQYDYFQIKNLCKCPSLVLCEEIEYWGYSWLISLSTGNTLRLLLFFCQIWVLALIFNTLIDHTACTMLLFQELDDTNLKDLCSICVWKSKQHNVFWVWRNLCSGGEIFFRLYNGKTSFDCLQ